MGHSSRRSFVKTSGALLAASAWVPTVLNAQPRHYKATVIGHTGRGDYGHGYDTIFSRMENVTVAAIADVDFAGRQKAAERSGAERQYADYREMLEKEKPDLVSIAPRVPGTHKEMALAAIDAGCHIFMEKPFTETVQEADEVLDAAEKKNIKIAVAHNRRYTAEFRQIQSLLDEGLIGTVLECKFHGKQDARSGGEDLIVLGTHDFDMLRMYFGDPQWCFAQITQEGRDVTSADVREGREPIRLAGDTVFAAFSFPKNIYCTWYSFKTDDHWNTNFDKREKWRFEIQGTKGILAYQPGFGAAYYPSPFPAHRDDGIAWQPLPQPKNNRVPEHEKNMARNLIHAIETDTQPLCSGYDGRWAVEMVAAVYQAHKQKGRVELPLKDRNDPLVSF